MSSSSPFYDGDLKSGIAKAIQQSKAVVIFLRGATQVFAMLRSEQQLTANKTKTLKARIGHRIFSQGKMYSLPSDASLAIHLRSRTGVRCPYLQCRRTPNRQRLPTRGLSLCFLQGRWISFASGHNVCSRGMLKTIHETH